MIKLRVFVVVDVQQSFSCIFRRREGNDFSQFRAEPELNETQGYAISR